MNHQQQLDLNNLELAHSQIQESNIYPHQNQNDHINPQQNSQQQQLKLWNKQFHLDQVKFPSTLNTRLIDQLDLNNLHDIEHITPAIRNIMDSKLEPQDFGEEKISYQQYFKIHQASISAFKYYLSLQTQKTLESQQQYHKFQKTKQKHQNLQLLKQQHLQKQQQNMETIKQLQWKINNLKKQSEQISNYKCSYCHQLFPQKQQLHSHLKKAHQSVVNQTIEMRQLQKQYSHPEVIKKKTQNEIHAIKQLKTLEKQIEKLPDSHKDKEKELVVRIGKTLNRNLNVKIQHQLDKLEQDKDQDLAYKQQKRAENQQNLNDLQQIFSEFEAQLETIKKYQHNLIDDQYVQSQQLKQIEDHQEKLRQQRKRFNELQVIDQHKTIMKQRAVERDIKESLSFGGHSQLIDQKNSWFFDNQLKPVQREEKELEKLGLGEFLKPDPSQYEPIILENSEDSRHYSNSISKENTEEFEQSATITSQNLPEDEQPFFNEEEQREFERNQQILLEEQRKKEQEDHLNNVFGDLESDKDSQADNIQEEIEMDRFMEKHNAYTLLIPENKAKILEEKESHYKHIRDQNFNIIHSELQPIQEQEQLYKDLQEQQQKLRENKLMLEKVKEELKAQENNQAKVAEKKKLIAENLHLKSNIGELEDNLRKLQKHTKRHQKHNDGYQSVTHNQKNINYLQKFQENPDYDDLHSKQTNELNELLYKIQSQNREQQQAQQPETQSSPIKSQYGGGNKQEEN